MRRKHPYQNFLYLGLGLAVAVVGIWISAAVSLLVVKGLGFLLLAPAGMLMAMGLCRLAEEGRKAGRLSLPPVHPALSRELSLSRAIRSACLSMARSMRSGGR